MSRCYHHIGLKEEAQKWLEENCVMSPSIVCPGCGLTIAEKLKVVKSHFEEMFYCDGAPLNTYEAKDGELVEEKMHDYVPWASGPFGFVYLEKNGKSMFKWKRKEMDSYL